MSPADLWPELLALVIVVGCVWRLTGWVEVPDE